MLIPLSRTVAVLIAGTALAGQSVSVAVVAADCPVASTENSTTSFGVGFATADIPVMGQARRQITIIPPRPEIPTSYMRLRLTVNQGGTAPWSVIFRDGDGRFVSSLDQRDTACTSPSGCWTERLGEQSETPRLVVSLVSDDPALKVQFLSGVVMGEHGDLTVYSAYEDHPYVDLYGPDAMATAGAAIADLRRAGDSVGMFSATASHAGLPISWCCSGFALTETLFMTNWHCGADRGSADTAFWTDSAVSGACQSGFVDFSWDGDLNKRELQCAGVVASEKHLDYALLRLSQVPGGNADVAIAKPLELAIDRPYDKEALRVIHHALCKPKQLSMDCNIVSTQWPSWDSPDPATWREIGHNCSTEGGSSGAPLLNEDNQIVAVQHLGFDCDNRNKAIDVHAILRSVRDRDPQIYAEILSVHPELDRRLQP